MKWAAGGFGGMEVVMGKLRLGILGNGYLAGIVVEAFEKGLLPEYELVGIMGRTPEKTGALAERAGCAPCGSIGELLDRKPDYSAGLCGADSGGEVRAGGAVHRGFCGPELL